MAVLQFLVMSEGRFNSLLGVFFQPQCSCKGDAPYQEPENMHKKSFHTSKSATSDHVRAYLEETLHPVE